MAISSNIGDIPVAQQSEATSRSAFGVMLASTALAIAAQELLYGATVGLSMTLLFLLGAGLTAMLVRSHILRIKRISIWLSVPIVAAALGFSLSDSRGLIFLNVVMILLALGLIAVIESEEALPSLWNTVLGSVVYPVAFPLLSLVLPFVAEWKRLRPAPQSKRTAGVFLGMAAALPFLLILGVILAQADPVFARLFSFSWDVDPDVFFARALIFGAVASFAAGAWSMMSSPLRSRSIGSASLPAPPTGYTAVRPGSAEAKEDSPKGIDPTQAISAFATFFGLIGLLFFVFILVQARYLFGGSDVVLKTEGLTYANYARRGFFEIVSVTIISLPILLGAQTMLKSVEAAHRRLFNAVAIGMSVLLLCLLTSAAVRMGLYVQAYGLSPMRFYVSAAIVWLASVIGLYIWLGVRWQLPRFGLACMATLFAVGIGLNLIRPDAIIVSVNLSRPKPENLDANMIVDAGADAWPALQSASPELKQKWLDKFAENERGWKSMNLSRWRVFQTGQVPPKPAESQEDSDSYGWD